MKIRETSVNSNDTSLAQNKTNIKKETNTPNFKAGFASAIGSACLNGAGGTMQFIQDGGFMTSFLIQDGLGMTAPRTATGFLRDKEVTGQYNIQEGFEVLGREGLTGPCMMLVPFVAFSLASIFGKSTKVNSLLIKRMGNYLKEMVASPNFDKELLKNKQRLKDSYIEKCMSDMLKNTLGDGNVDQTIVNDIIKLVSKYENVPEKPNVKGLFKKSKYRSQVMSDIIKYIDNIKYNTSSDLNLLGNLKVGNAEDTARTFSTKEAIDSMLKYAEDVITNNKNLANLDEKSANSIKNSSIAKRMIANVATLASTLGVLFVLPKIYLKSNISPGARTAMQIKEQNKLAEEGTSEEIDSKNENNVSNTEKNQEISFKANTSKETNWFRNFIKKHKEDIISEFQFNGNNFTNTLMATLSIGGLLAPRMIRANQRAMVDENGKKDRSELYEILIRDVTSSLAVVFVVPMLTRAFVTSYEKNSGFVLLQKDRNQSSSKKYLDLLNPYSKTEVLSNKQIASIYNGVDSQEKMINFCKFIDNNEGDLEKILSKSDAASKYLENDTIKLSELSKQTRKQKNETIIEYFRELGSRNSKAEVDKIVTELMRNVEKPSQNKIFAFARGLNSLPALLTTVLISPFILGWCIPRLTYANTRKMHEKAEEERRLKTSA